MRRSKPIIYELISLRYNLQPSKNDQFVSTEMSLLLQTPTMDKQQFNKLSEELKQGKAPEEAIQHTGFKFVFNFENLEQLFSLTNDRKKQTSEIFTVIVCFNAIGWSGHDIKHEQKGFELLMDLFNIFNTTENVKIINFCFERVLSVALDSKSGFVWSRSSIQSVIAQFFTNDSFESSTYPLFIRFIDMVSQMPFEECIRDSQLLLDQIIIDNRKIICGNDLIELQYYLTQFLSKTDMLCLRVLCHLSQRSGDDSFNELFSMSASAFLEHINGTVQPFKIESVEGFRTPSQFPKIFEFDAINGIDTMNGGLIEPVLDDVESNEVLESYLEETILSLTIEFGKILMTATDISKIAFFSSMMDIIAAVENYTTACACLSSFLIMFKKNRSKSIFKNILPIIMQSVVMNQELTIYGKEKLHPLINLIRKNIVEEAYSLGLDLIVDILDCSHNNPIFFTELLSRVMATKMVSYDFYRSGKILKYITQSALLLSVTDFPKKYEARCTTFFIVFKFLENPLIARYCFSNVTFSHNFLCFVFEEPMQESVILAFTKVLPRIPTRKSEVILTAATEYICKLFSICMNHCEDERYLIIIRKFSEELIKALAECNELTVSFQTVMKKMLDFIEQKPDSVILNCVLKFLVMKERADERFILDRSLFAKIVNAIKLVEGKEPSASTRSLLISLLSGYQAITTDKYFYIKEPSIIPLIIAVLGRSKHFNYILEIFYALCKYSTYNTIKLHDGDFDYIMMGYITKKQEEASFLYRNVEIVINMKERDVEKYVYPIIEIISLTKSSNAVATTISSFVSKQIDEITYDFGLFLNRMLVKCSLTPRPSFTLTTDEEPQFYVSGLFGDDLNDGFTITCRINVDIEPLTDSGASLTLFTIEDENESLMRAYIQGNKILLKYEEDCTRTTVYLVKQIPSQEWVFYTFAFSWNEGQAIITSYQGQEMLNNSELCEFSFNPQKLQFSVGGVDEPATNPLFKNTQLGMFGDFCLYNEYLVGQEIIDVIEQGMHSSIKPLFTSSCIRAAGERATFTVPREKHEKGSLFGASTNKLTITVTDCKSPSINLLDTIIDGGSCESLMSFFENNNPTIKEYPSLIVNIINMLFLRSIAPQSNFNVNFFIVNLFQSPQIVNSELYLAAYRAFESIKDVEKRVQWFRLVIFHTWLWINADSDQFATIISHWYNVVIPNNVDILKTDAFFTELLAQFKIIFCFNKEDDDVKAVEDLQPEGVHTIKFFNKTYSVQKVMESRAYFMKIIKRVAFCNFVGKDFVTLFTQLSTSKTSTSILLMLKLIIDIKKQIISTGKVNKEWMQILHNYVRNNYNDDITEYAILAIHELSEQMVNINAHAIVSEIQSTEKRKRLFKRLLERVSYLPNLVYIIFMLALELGNDAIQELAEKVYSVKSWTGISFKQNWFFWPVIVLLNADDNSQFKFISFIITLLKMSPNIGADSTLILYLIIFIHGITAAQTNSKIEKLFLYSWINAFPKNEKLTNSIVYDVFTFVFFRIWTSQFSPSLVKTVNESPFGPFEYKPGPSPIFMPCFSTVEQVEQLALFDFSFINIKFQILLNEDAVWIDRDVISATFDAIRGFTQTNENEYTKNIISYLQRSSNSAGNGPDSLNFFEQELAKYQKKFISTLTNLFKSVHVGFESVKNLLIGNCEYKPEKFMKEALNLLNKEFEQSLTFPSTSIKNKVTLTADSTICSAFCPLKKKRKREKAHKQIEIPPDPIVVFKDAALIKGSNTKKMEVYVFKDKIILSSATEQKLVPTKLIQFIFTTGLDGSKENCIELFLTNGKHYLINFETTDISIVVKAFPNSQMSNLVFVQSLKEKQYFMKEPYTNLWCKGKMSTFEYLMLINVYAGRSFYITSKQPIMPAFLTNFEDDKNIQNFSTKVDIDNSQLSLSTLAIANPRANANARVFIDPSVQGNLPHWAKDKNEFIYKIKLMLDRSDVVTFIPEWIDKMFGKDMKKKHLDQHRRLFVKQHPMRTISEDPLSRNTSIKYCPDNEKIVRALCCSNPEKESFFNITAISSSGVVYTIEFSIQKDITIHGEKHNQIGTSVAPYSPFSSSEKSMLLYTPETRKTYIIKKGKVALSITLFTETILFCNLKDSFLFCPDYCTVAYIDENEQKLKTHKICNSPCRITTLACSEKFKVVAFGSIDGNISVHDMNNNLLVNIVNIGCEAEHLIITKINGFIIAVTSTKIIVLTINAEPVRESAIQTPVMKVFEFQCRGTDYIACHLSDNRLIFFEALYPEKRVVLHETKENIESICYSRFKESFIILTEDSIICIPFRI